MALSPLTFHQAGHCTHAFAGVFGSAAAASALAGLTAEQAGWALSYAAQQAAGVTSWRRAVEHVEKAFVFAGDAGAQRRHGRDVVASGFTGVNDVLHRRAEFLHHVRPGAAARSSGRRGSASVMRFCNTTIKKWSVGSPAQSVLDAMHMLMQDHRIDHREIAEIPIRMAPIEIDTVDNRAMPDISLQHLVVGDADRRRR